MKKITLFLAIVVFAACQKEVLSDEKAPIDIEAFQTRTIETSIFSDNPVSYLANTDFSLWTKVESLEERFSVCDISEDMVKAMTTDAIVRSVLHYPLNYIIFAYN